MAYIYDLTDTWNAGGTTFNAIKMNVTDSASAAGSKLVTLQTNGTEHFSVTKAGVGYFSGNVGIGTSSPSAKLQVDGPFIRYGNSASYTSDEFIIQRVAAGVNLSVRQNVAMMLLTNDTERMRIDASGNVGIGTSSPARTLSVYSASSIPAQIESSGTDARISIVTSSGSGGQGFIQASSGALLLGSSNTERARIDTSGNVGIGTSSPTSISNYKAITLDATTGTFIDFRENGTNRLRIGGDGGTAFVNGASGTLRLLTSDVERARIDASGNVGIGTSSPDIFGRFYTRSVGINSSGTTTLQINGTTYSGIDLGFNGTRTANILAEAAGFYLQTVTASPMVFITNSTERARIDSSGNLLVGTTSAIASGRISVQSTGSAPALVGRSASDSIQLYTTQTSGTSYFGYWVYNGTNVGSITSTGTTTAYNTSSDARLKHDIVDAPEASSLIDAIKVRSFKWNADNSEQRYGMIAQELLEVAPEAVSHDPDDEEKMMGVDYSKLVPMLVKEIQSLRARVAQLEGN